MVEYTYKVGATRASARLPAAAQAVRNASNSHTAVERQACLIRRFPKCSVSVVRAKLELLYPIATVAEPSCCVGCSNGFEGIGDGLIECFFGSCLGVAQELLEFGPGLLDGVQVWRVGRQIEQLRTAGFDPLAYPSPFVRRQVVHHHHIAGL